MCHGIKRTFDEKKKIKFYGTWLDIANDKIRRQREDQSFVELTSITIFGDGGQFNK